MSSTWQSVNKVCGAGKGLTLQVHEERKETALELRRERMVVILVEAEEVPRVEGAVSVK